MLLISILSKSGNSKSPKVSVNLRTFIVSSNTAMIFKTLKKRFYWKCCEKVRRWNGLL